MAALGKVLVWLGVALLALTGYQATSYRENLRLTQQQFEGLPLALLAQLAAAVALCVVGGLQESGSFKPIRLADVPKTVVTRPHRTDFAVFNHRGRILGQLPHMQQLPSVPEIRR